MSRANTSHRKPTMIELDQSNYKGTIRFSSQGQYRELSNLFHCKVEYDGETLDSSEHHYQGKKGDYHHTPEIANKIRQATDGKTARSIAKSEIHTNQEWHRYKRDLLYDIVLAKLECNPDIREMLMTTKEKYLLEGTPTWYWGEGFNGTGRNEMGKILMHIRDGPYSKPEPPRTHPVTSIERQPAKVLLLGNSQANHIHPEKFSTKSKLVKVQLYTLPEVTNWLKSDKSKEHSNAKTIVIHQITNDVKEKNESQCVCDLTEAVKQTKITYPACKVVVSLGTPREDHLKQKVMKVNSMVRDMYKHDDSVILCHHDNLQQNGQAKPGLLAVDKYHLTENGTKLVASNIRHAVEPWRRQYSSNTSHHINSREGKPYYMSRSNTSTGEKPTYSGMVSGNPLLPYKTHPLNRHSPSSTSPAALPNALHVTNTQGDKDERQVHTSNIIMTRL